MANICTAITVEGILQQKVGSGPIQAGINLYNGLASVSNVILLTDQKEKDLEHWLKIENLIKHDMVLGSSFVYSLPHDSERRLQQVKELRKRGNLVNLVFEPDPTVCSVLIENGFNTCCFIHASYADPVWRPDYEGSVRAWDDMVETIVQQKLARLEDERLREKDPEVNER